MENESIEKEIWDVYDKDRNKTGRFHVRGEPMAVGDYHIVVHVWKRNAKGEWLIDKRTARYGRSDIDGKWETTGGSAIAGDDSLTAALRETKEELGIDLDPQKGELFYSGAVIADDGHGFFRDVWVFDCDKPIGELVLDESEVCDAMWASVDKIRAMMASGEMLGEGWHPYFEDMVSKYEQNAK